MGKSYEFTKSSTDSDQSKRTIGVKNALNNAGHLESLLCTSEIHLAPTHIATLVLFDVGWVLYFISLCQSPRWSVQGF